MSDILDLVKPEYGGRKPRYQYRDDHAYAMECYHCKGIFHATGKQIRSAPLLCSCRPFDRSSTWRRLDDGAPLAAVNRCLPPLA